MLNGMVANFLWTLGNVALLIIVLVLLLLSRDGFKFLSARLSKTPLLFEFNPVTKTMRIIHTKSDTLYDKKEDIYFLGDSPAYKYGDVPVFLVIKGQIPTVPPDVVAEVQKSLSVGVDTHERLQEVIKQSLLEEHTQEKVIDTPEGPKKVIEKYLTLKPLMTIPHRVVHMRIKPTKKGKEVDVTFDVEMYEPLKIETVTNYFSRTLSSLSVKKILAFRDLAWAERTMKVYQKIKEVKRGVGGGGGFNPIWLIYLGIFIFIVFMAVSIYGHGGGGATGAVTPPMP